MVHRLMEFLASIGKGELPAKDFTTQDAKRFLGYAIEEYGISARTSNNYRNWCRALFGEMIDSGIVRFPGAKNPWSRTRARKTKRGAGMDLWSDQERTRVVSHLKAHDPALLVFASFVYYCFLRPKEICRLQLRDVRLSESQIIIPAAKAKTDAGAVGIPKVFLPVVEQWISEAKSRSGYTESWLLFSEPQFLQPGPRRYGAKTMAARVSERFRAHREQLGLRHTLKLYGLKDTGAHRLRQTKKVDLKSISGHMRHARLNITDSYLHQLEVRGGDIMQHMPEL